MRLAIMQPYFLPYIGYFQLIAAVDQFVVYDNIKYTKKGWINRNRLLANGRDGLFTLPLKSGSDSLHVHERELAASFQPGALRDQFLHAYRLAPYVQPTMALLDRILQHPDRNLFRFTFNAIVCVCEHLGIRTPLLVSSRIPIDHTLKGQDKVLALCQQLGADTYLNAIGGRTLYEAQAFRERGIKLQFLQSRLQTYPQFGQPFVPWLSIVDVLMFNPVKALQDSLLGAWDTVHE
jgi:hypothetical protein